VSSISSGVLAGNKAMPASASEPSPTLRLLSARQNCKLLSILSL
jgi:hypothetical protein